MKKKKDRKSDKQIQLRGIPAAPGIAIGKAYVFGTEEALPPKRPISKEEIPASVLFHK